MGAAQTIARVREKENTIRALEAAVADLEIQREEHRKLALVADAEKTNVARQGRANRHISIKTSPAVEHRHVFVCRAESEFADAHPSY